MVECVPNFSEGRDGEKIRKLEAAIASVAGTLLLDTHADPDHNRSVITFAGPPDAVAESAIRAAGKAAELIDLRSHQGAHPRIGALDVLPFVPLCGVEMDDCVALARRVGKAIWERHGIPVYFYEQASLRPDRVNLAALRSGGFEGLREQVRLNPDRAPDVGAAGLHPTAGAVAVGARQLLIAYNIDLATDDRTVADAIAKAVRASSGGLAGIKAMGVLLESKGRAQVSMNLTDFRTTPPHVAFEAVQREAARLGTRITDSELVGLIPEKAVDMAGGRDLRIRYFHGGRILENRIAEVLSSRR
jgi:glutamate formiminotransferase